MVNWVFLRASCSCVWTLCDATVLSRLGNSEHSPKTSCTTCLSATMGINAVSPSKDVLLSNRRCGSQPPTRIPVQFLRGPVAAKQPVSCDSLWCVYLERLAILLLVVSKKLLSFRTTFTVHLSSLAEAVHTWVRLPWIPSPALKSQPDNSDNHGKHTFFCSKIVSFAGAVVDQWENICLHKREKMTKIVHSKFFLIIFNFVCQIYMNVVFVEPRKGFRSPGTGPPSMGA